LIRVVTLPQQPTADWAQVMPLPSDIEPLLSSKKSRERCELAKWFCIPCIRAFRFMIDELDFRITEVATARHDAWVTFRHRNIKLTISTELGCERWGTISVLKDARSNSIRKTVYFRQLLPRFYAGQELPRFKYDDDEQELALWARIVKENWDEIVSEVLALADEHERAKRHSQRAT